MVAINAKLQRIFETAIGYAVKHNRLPRNRLLFSGCNSMLPKESVEVCAVDIDFAPDLREGDDALIPVVLPCLGRDSEDVASCFGFDPFVPYIVSVAVGY